MSVDTSAAPPPESNSLVFHPRRVRVHDFCRAHHSLTSAGYSQWRIVWDSNPGTSFRKLSLSRRAPSASRSTIQCMWGFAPRPGCTARRRTDSMQPGWIRWGLATNARQGARDKALPSGLAHHTREGTPRALHPPFAFFRIVQDRYGQATRPASPLRLTVLGLRPGKRHPPPGPASLRQATGAIRRSPAPHLQQRRVKEKPRLVF